MSHAPKYQNHFPVALRLSRKAKGRSQEDFSLHSSRTYISTLERGLKVPTLSKVEDLASVLGIHPLTLLAMSYLDANKLGSVQELLGFVQLELIQLIDPNSKNQEN